MRKKGKNCNKEKKNVINDWNGWEVHSLAEYQQRKRGIGFSFVRQGRSKFEVKGEEAAHLDEHRKCERGDGQRFMMHDSDYILRQMKMEK